MVAQRALFEAGLELAGVRLQLFAERLLDAADVSPEASCDELVRTTLRDMDENAVALVAEVPELCDRRLSRAAVTVNDAAETALRTLARVLLAADRKR